MANNSIYLANQVQTDDVKFEGPLANSYGGKYAKVTHNGRWLLVQTPRMVCPFGVNVYEEKDHAGNVTGKKTYSMDLSFAGYQNISDPSKAPRKPKVKQFYDFIQNMETKLVKHACKNSFTWLDDPNASEDVCRALLRSGIKWSRDKVTKALSKKYPPRLKISLPVYDNDMAFKVFMDSRDNEIKDVSELVHQVVGKCEVVVIGRCEKVTFNGGKYGYKWSAVQLKVFSSTDNMAKYAFIDDSDGEDVAQTEQLAQSTTFIADSDDPDSEQKLVVENNVEDEDELDDQVSDSVDMLSEEEKPPTPKPKKKRGRKKIKT